MESKQIRSSVITRSMRFNGQFQPLLPPYSRQDRVFERQNQQKRYNQKRNSDSNSGFRVIPTMELCRVHLQKPVLLASKGIIDAQSKPPHSQKKLTKLISFNGEMANHRRFGKRYDQQNLKLKLKPKTRKKENSPRCFSPLGFGSDSQLRDKKKPKEMKKLCDQKMDRFVREVGSKLMVSTSRNSNGVAANVKFKPISSSSFISKGENEDSLDCTNASPGCQTNSEEAHQPSPVSVLEAMFYEDMLDYDDEELRHLVFHGLEKQLDTLKSESENYADGSGMEVSSDEESVLDCEPIEFLDTKESRDSSYINDILTEVKLWVPEKQDLVITPKIFEKLEKKYYTETSWKRSERRILFDRVNSSLVEILESFKATPTSKKPVSRRLCCVLSTSQLKQELWEVLIKQEKQESLAKMPVIDIDEWLKLEADDESVVVELESMIVDELLSDVVSFI